MSRVLLAVVALLLAETASAHSVSARFGEVYSGLLHPLTTLAHLVPWLALGLMAGALPARHARWVLAVFPVAVAAGALAEAVFGPWTAVTTINLASFIVLGVLVVAFRSLGLAAFVTITIIVGLSHGYANNGSGLSGGPLLLYVIGLMLAAYFCVALTAALATFVARQPSWGHIAIRAAGSWIVAIGLVFSGFTLLGQ